MEKAENNKSLDKMRFYDTNFKVLGISILLSFIVLLLPYSIGEEISFLAMMVAIVPFLIIGWGMFYHQFKSQEWLWLLPSILLTIFGLGFIILSVFYFKVMRKEFQKGNGIYN